MAKTSKNTSKMKYVRFVQQIINLSLGIRPSLVWQILVTTIYLANSVVVVITENSDSLK